MTLLELPLWRCSSSRFPNVILRLLRKYLFVENEQLLGIRFPVRVYILSRRVCVEKSTVLFLLWLRFVMLLELRLWRGSSSRSPNVISRFARWLFAGTPRPTYKRKRAVVGKLFFLFLRVYYLCRRVRFGDDTFCWFCCCGCCSYSC